MKCKTLHKKLIFFLEGDLSPVQMEEVQNHLDGCSSCAAFAREMKLTLGIIDIEKTREVNPYFYTRLKAKLENRAAQNSPAFGRLILAKVLQPAFFSVLLILGIYSGIKIGQPASNKEYTVILMQNQEIPYLNEMATETIETSLME
jgi:predicted anti-sigma-YlaC factor YlaD